MIKYDINISHHLLTKNSNNRKRSDTLNLIQNKKICKNWFKLLICPIWTYFEVEYSLSICVNLTFFVLRMRMSWEDGRSQ